MGVALRYMRRKPGSILLEYRREFPKALRPFIGEREHKVSLKGTSEADPSVLKRWSEANEEAERLIRLAQRRASGEFDARNSDVIQRLVDAYGRERLPESGLFPIACSQRKAS